MKPILQIIIVALIVWLVIWLDTLLYDFIIGLIPPTAWLGFIKLVLVIVMIAYTTGIAFWSVLIGSAIALGILNIFMPDEPYKFNFRSNHKKKSRFQERLEKEQLRRRNLED